MKIEEIRPLAKSIYETNVEKGFWDKPRKPKVLSLLFSSEVFEAFETDRKNPDMPSEKCPGHTHFNEELADVIIRLLDVLWGKNPEMFSDENWRDHSSNTILESPIDLMWELNAIFASCPTPSMTRLDREGYLPYTEFVRAISLIENYTGPIIWQVVEAKLAFNKTRSKMHGGKRY